MQYAPTILCREGMKGLDSWFLSPMDGNRTEIQDAIGHLAQTSFLHHATELYRRGKILHRRRKIAVRLSRMCKKLPEARNHLTHVGSRHGVARWSELEN